MELRLLRYFVAVAELENVGKAALRLHISQSPLSRQLHQLEDELGLQLFDRGRHGARLTDAGRALLEPAKDLLSRAGRFVTDAQRIAEGQLGKLAVGYVHTALFSGLLPRAVRQLKQKSPQVRIELKHQSSHAQLAGLLSGELDLGLMYRFEPHPTLFGEPVLDERFVMAIAQAHPLARRRQLSVNDLASTAWISVAESGRERVLNTVGRRFAPEIAAEVGDWASALSLVESGLGAALVPSSLGRMPPEGVVLRALPWFRTPLRLWLVGRATGRSPAAVALGKLLRRPSVQ